MLTYILEQFSKSSLTISPRIAIMAAETIAVCGPDALAFIADFNAKPDLLKTSISKFESLLKITNLIGDTDIVMKKTFSVSRTTLDGIKELQALNKALNLNISKLKAIKADDSLIQQTTDAIKKYSEFYEKIRKEIEIILSVDSIMAEGAVPSGPSMEQGF